MNRDNAALAILSDQVVGWSRQGRGDAGLVGSGKEVKVGFHQRVSKSGG